MIEIKQTSPKVGYYGDCTADYAVIFKKDYTVREFIDEIITHRSGEWGCIGISTHDNEAWAQFCSIKCSYRWGKMESKFSDKWLDRHIESATGHGGYSNMDYILKLK